MLAGIFTLTTIQVNAQDKPAYKIFDKDGKEVSYETMLEEVKTAEIIFFGEIHNNPIAHWLELELFKNLLQQNKKVALAMEMLEADNQLILNEYLKGKIEESHFLQEAKLWDNYKTDYRPLIEEAKEHQKPVIATNIPRRYANIVYRRGIEALDSLSDEAKQYIAPLPVVMDLQLSSYQGLMQSMGNHGRGSGENLAKAQAIKDATMAHFIAKTKGRQILHINGSYHSESGEGIIWFLKQMKPGSMISTIQTVEQDDITILDQKHKEKADYLICIPSSMTKTFYSR